MKSERPSVHASTLSARLIAGAMVLGCLALGPAAAKVKSGTTFAIADSASALNDRLGIAANAKNGEILVTWTLDTDTGGATVVGQRVAVDRSLPGQAFSISPTPVAGSGLRDQAPAAAYNASRKEYFVVYYRGASGTAPAAILGRRLAADGSPRSSELSVLEGNGLGYPAVAWDSVNDQYLVAWGGESGLQGRVLAGDGTLLGTADLSSEPAGNDPPAMVFSPTLKKYVLAFQSPAAENLNVMGLFADTDGQVRGSAFSIAAPKRARGSRPTLALNPTGAGFTAIWTDSRKKQPRVFIRRFQRNGQPLGSPQVLAASAQAPQLLRSTSGFLAIWTNRSNAVAGRLLRSDLSPMSTVFKIPPPQADTVVRAPAVAAFPGTGRALIAGVRGRPESGTDSGPVLRIYGQVVALNPAVTQVQVTVTGTDKASIPTTSSPPAEVNYTVVITNSDTVTAKKVTLVDTPPTAATSVQTDRGQCSGDTRLTCKLGALAPGESATIQITAKVSVSSGDCTLKTPTDAVTKVTNSASVSWANQATDANPVQTQMDTSISYKKCG